MRRLFIAIVLALLMSGCETTLTFPPAKLEFKPLIRDGCDYPALCTADGGKTAT